MTEKYTIDILSNITYIHFILDPSYKDIQDVLDKLVEDQIYEKRLYDLIDVKFDLTTNELKSMAEYGKRIFSKPNKAAMVTNQDLAFGEGRQFSAYREDDNCKFSVFRNKEEAIDWLNQP